MDGLRNLVNDLLTSAGNLAEGAVGAASKALDDVTGVYRTAYDHYISEGMSVSDAADKAEIAARNYMRDVYGFVL